MSVTLKDFPADVIGALQRFICDHIPRGRICEVFRPADLYRLRRKAHRFALILVYPTPGHLRSGLIAQWHLERQRRTRLPMVLLVGDQVDQESPGPVLGLGIGPTEVSRLRNMFAADPPPDSHMHEFLSQPWGPRIAAKFDGLQALFNPVGDPLWIPRSLRSVQVLRGLLAGHCLWRRLGDAPGGLDLVAPDLDDYVGVYGLLRRSRAGLPGEMGDPLLAAMIRRANFYIESREKASQESQPIPIGREGNSSLPTTQPGQWNSAHDRPRLISLRELADLGNLRSAMAKRLINDAQRPGDLKAILKLGLIKRLPEGTRPESLDKEAISGLMFTWSMKQVRKRFDTLRREGYIEAERVPAGNGPWVIQLPEELKPLPVMFEGLPAVERVAEACRRE